MTKGIATLIVAAADPDLRDPATTVLRGLILDCIRLTTPPPPSSGGLPKGFSDLNIAPVFPSGGGGTGAVISPGGLGATAADKAAGAMRDSRVDAEFSPLEVLSEHMRGRKIITPREITNAIVDGLSDVRKDVQGVALDLVE